MLNLSLSIFLIFNEYSNTSHEWEVNVNMKVIMSKVYANQIRDSSNKILISHMNNNQKNGYANNIHKIKEAISWIKKLQNNLDKISKSEMSSESPCKFVSDF